MSEKFSIIIIKPNNLSIKNIKLKTIPNYDVESYNENNLMQSKLNYLDIEYFKDLIKDLIIIDNEVTSENFVKKLVEYMEMTPEMYADTKTCLENKNNLYQICHLPLNQNPTLKNKEENYLGGLLGYDSELVHGNVIFFNTNLPINDFSSKNINVTIDDILYVLISNCIHSGVQINTKGELKQLFYNNNFDIIKLNHELKKDESIEPLLSYDICEEEEKSLFKYNLNFFIKKSKDCDKNEVVSKILEKDVYGDVFVISRLTEEILDDVTKEDIENILEIYDYGIKLKEEEKEDHRDKEGRITIKNKYRIVNNRKKSIEGINI